MSGWIAMHRSEDADTLQERHPAAWLLLCQIGRRARWKRESCPITGLSFGQAMIGDWKRAGLQSEKSYRHAMGILKRAGLVAFKGANKGTIATLVSTSIFSIGTDSTGEQTVDQTGAPAGTVKGERRGGPGATKNKGNKGTDETRNQESESAGDLFAARSAPAELPQPDPGELARIERIVGTYPRREKLAECLRIVADHLAAGIDPAEILSGTQRIAAVIAQLPSGHLNPYLPGADKFFRDKRWMDDPETWRRQSEKASTSSNGKRQLTLEEIKERIGGRWYEDEDEEYVTASR